MIAPVLSKIARRYDAAANTSATGRMPRTAVTAILVAAYRAIDRWHDEGIRSRATRLLRRKAGRAIDFRSNDYLVLLRTSLPDFDRKKASKWAAALDAADYHEIAPADLRQFLIDMGGVEGAARERARLWATVEDGDWAGQVSDPPQVPEATATPQGGKLTAKVVPF